MTPTVQTEGKTKEMPSYTPTGPEAERMDIVRDPKIPLGLMIALFSVFVVLITSAYWLGSTLAEIKTEVRSAVSLLQSVSTRNGSLESRQVEHERADTDKWTQIDKRLSQVEISGSDKTRELERELTALKAKFDLHEAIQKKGLP